MGVSLNSSLLSTILILVLYPSHVYPHTTDEYRPSVLYNLSNSTQVCVKSIGTEYSLLILLPALLLGSNYVLLKRYNKGDGVFFQWLVSVGLWICGFVVNIVQAPAQFYVFAMLGGIVWCGGNFLLIPMIRLVGFTTGVLIWSLVFMSTGWATGFLNLLGVPHDSLCVPFFNYGGLVMCVSGVILLAFLKDSRASIHGTHRAYNNLTITSPAKQVRYECWIVNRFVLNLSPFKKKVIGYIMSILMGIAWGTHLLPMQILLVLSKRDTYYSNRALDYVFPYSTGVLLTSTVLTAVYSLYMRNKPSIEPQSILPALAVGALTGIAISLWAHLNMIMSPAITFPVIATGTPTVGFLTSIVAYRGWRNVFISFVSVFVILCGIVLVILSKVHPFSVFTNFPFDNVIV